MTDRFDNWLDWTPAEFIADDHRDIARYRHHLRRHSPEVTATRRSAGDFGILIERPWPDGLCKMKKISFCTMRPTLHQLEQEMNS